MVIMTYPKVDSETSEKFWLLKAFAIIAVVACHCTNTIDNPGRINTIATYFFDAWKGSGVPVFYFCAGFFFKDGNNFLSFVKNKMLSIVLPWIFTGTLIWLYIVLRKGGVSFDNWLGYLFLRDSYLYFLTDLMIFYVIMYVAHKSRYIYIALCVYTAISCIIPTFTTGYVSSALTMPYAVLGISSGYWLYFCLGTVCRQLNVIKYINNQKLVYFIFVVAFLAVAEAMFNKEIGILFYIGLFKNISLMISLYNIRSILNKLNLENIAVYLGKLSFSLYLLHMPIAGIVANILNRSEAFAPLTFVRPIIVIAITAVLIEAYKRIVKNNDKMLMLIGIRRV